jgi:cyclic pyranopterin phosphate synthase
LDSLVSEKFKKITRGGDLEMVFKGIDLSLSAGFNPLKINVVLMKGVNDDEIKDFINLAKYKPLHIRFIEYMPTFSSSSRAVETPACRHDRQNFASLHSQEAKNILSSMGGQKDFIGTIGFISPLSEPFCDRCNKLRLTSDGWLRSCLHSSRGVDLKAAIRNGSGKDVLAELIREAVGLKPKSHNLTEVLVNGEAENFSMCQIGG